MTIDYQAVKHWPFADAVCDYQAEDCIRYALSLAWPQTRSTKKT